MCSCNLFTFFAVVLHCVSFSLSPLLWMDLNCLQFGASIHSLCSTLLVCVCVLEQRFTGMSKYVHSSGMKSTSWRLCASMTLPDDAKLLPRVAVPKQRTRVPRFHILSTPWYSHFASLVDRKWYFPGRNVEATCIPLWSWAPNLWLVAMDSPWIVFFPGPGEPSAGLLPFFFVFWFIFHLVPNLTFYLCGS